MTTEELARKCAREIKLAVDKAQKECGWAATIKYPREIEVDGRVFDFGYLLGLPILE